MYGTNTYDEPLEIHFWRVLVRWSPRAGKPI